MANTENPGKPVNRTLAFFVFGALGVLTIYFGFIHEPPKPEPTSITTTDQPRSRGNETGFRNQTRAVVEDNDEVDRLALLQAQKDQLAATVARLEAENAAKAAISNDRPQLAKEERLRSGGMLFSRRMPGSASSEQVQVSDPNLTAAAALAAALNDEKEEKERFAIPESVPTHFSRVAAVQTTEPETTIMQGKVIKAVLETGINSNLPGTIRAVVSEHIYSEDGSQILIPKLSRLLGNYQAAVTQGESRVFIIWERIILPDYSTIGLASPGTDALGVAGMTGDVKTHFLQRFGGSLLLSMIGIGAREASTNDGNNNINVVSNDFQNAASIALQNSINIPPTITVPHGSRVNVFVNQDLDFSSVRG